MFQRKSRQLKKEFPDDGGIWWRRCRHDLQSWFLRMRERLKVALLLDEEPYNSFLCLNALPKAVIPSDVYVLSCSIMFGALPPKQGLYDPAFEKDACGVGFIVNIDGSRNHEVRTLLSLVGVISFFS